MKTLREFMEDDDMDYIEAAETAINNRKYLLNRHLKWRWKLNVRRKKEKILRSFSYNVKNQIWVNMVKWNKGHILNLNGTRVDCHVGYLDFLSVIILIVLIKRDPWNLDFLLSLAQISPVLVLLMCVIS